MTQCLRMVRCGASHFEDGDTGGVFIDFENPVPTETEEEVYGILAKVLEQAEHVLTDVSTYGDGALKAVREAIGNPENEEIQKESWETLLPYILRLRIYHQFSASLDQAVPLLLWELCNGPLPPLEQLDSRQALTTQFAKLVDFVLRFDEIKMRTSSMQNDFSFYRRSMSRRSLAFGITLEEDAIIPVDEANVLSLYYAQPTPMLDKLKSAVLSFVYEHPQLPLTNTTDTIGSIANVCRATLESPALMLRFSKPDSPVFCLRVMVGAIILYDHLSDAGAFVRSSVINTKAAIRLLKEDHHSDEKWSGTLLNTLRFHSKHLHDPSTPKDIRSLLLA